MVNLYSKARPLRKRSVTEEYRIEEKRERDIIILRNKTHNQKLAKMKVNFSTARQDKEFKDNHAALEIYKIC